MPEQFRGDDGPDLAGFAAHYQEMEAAQAIAAEAKGDVPEDASGYEYALTEDFNFGEIELPEDFSVELNVEDPAFAPLFEELGGIMHKHGLPKGASGELLGVLAKYKATEFSQSMTAAQAEMTSLGTAAKSRIANIERTLESRLPPEMAVALKDATRTADGVKALEKLLAPRALSNPLPTPLEEPEANPLAARYPSSAS